MKRRTRENRAGAVPRRFRLGRRAAAFSLVEILIAIFVFMVGILGVLAIFPVAIDTAWKAIGGSRTVTMGESALALLAGDTIGVCDRVQVLAAPAPTSTVIACEVVGDPTATWADDQWNGYFATVTESGSPARWQSRLIVDSYYDVGTSTNQLVISPPWNPIPAGAASPGGDEIAITRMGLPSLPRGQVASVAVATLTFNAALTLTAGDWDGYYVHILDGRAQGDIRRIVTTNAGDLVLDQGWPALIEEPEADDLFAITRTRPRVLYSGTATGAAASSLSMAGAAWLANEWDGYYVQITSGVAEGEIRRITLTAATSVTISPDWTTQPALGDDFLIVARGTHVGVVRQLVSATDFHAGVECESGTRDVVPMLWQDDGLWAGPTTLHAGNATGGADFTLTDTGEAWPDYSGSLVVITKDNNTDRAFSIEGQVRLITSNTAEQLTVWPDWSLPSDWSHAADWAGAQDVEFEIRDRLGHFVVFTDGDARGRILRVTGQTADDLDADTFDDIHRITCDTTTTSGTENLKEFRVTEAMRSTGAATAEYRLRNATRFMIIGNRSFLSSVHMRMDGEFNPNTELDPVTTGDPPADRRYTLNAFGIPKSHLPQVGADMTIDETGLAAGRGREQVTSEYDVVCIFGDSGPFPDGPVRVDAFVFRNFDSTKSLAENKKPVGFVTGFLGRP